MRPLRLTATMPPDRWLQVVRHHLAAMDSHGTLDQRIIASRAALECERLHNERTRTRVSPSWHPPIADDYSY